MAKSRSDRRKAKPKKGNAITNYLRETRAELRKVNWPSREEAWNLTKIVLVVTVGMAILLGSLDYLFALEMTAIFAGNAVAIAIAIIAAVGSALVVIILSRQRV